MSPEQPIQQFPVVANLDDLMSLMNIGSTVAPSKKEEDKDENYMEFGEFGGAQKQSTEEAKEVGGDLLGDLMGVRMVTLED